MLRAGRFRHRLLDEHFLINQGPLAHECLQKFLPLWHQKILSDMEIAGIYILIFAFLRRPKDFLGGVHHENLAASSPSRSIRGDEVIDLLREVLPVELRGTKSLGRLAGPQAFLPHFCSLSWRSIPLSAQQSLMAWRAGKYPLRLLTVMPSPEEVLHMQTQGLRCVSMLIKKDEMQAFVAEGRDVLGFIIHDLIHADHFFADPEKARAQVHFSQKLLSVRKLPQIQYMLATDPAFEDEFHYLMSDMNSVPLHLLKTLKAILLGFYKRREGVAMSASLTTHLESEFTVLFETVLKPWDFTPEALNAARRLNTPAYQGLDDAASLHQALQQTAIPCAPFFARI